MEAREGGRALLRLGIAAMALYSLGLLSIGIREDWRLMHEDNGAMQTTLALSHLKLGLKRTRAHDVVYDPRSGEAAAYGHHPPATALLVAAGFSLAGSDAPWVARSVVIAFQIASLLLLASLLGRFFPSGAVLIGLFLFATLPMGAFFGRMVNYEAICLFAVLLQLCGFAALCESSWQRGLGLLLLGVVAGALVDWPSFFFTLAIFGVAALGAFRGERGALRAAVLTAATAASAFLFDVAHLWWANHGSLDRLRQIDTGLRVAGLDFLLGQLENFRRYFTFSGLAASLLAAAALAAPGTALSQRLFDMGKGGSLRRLLWVSGAAPAGYVLAGPYYAAKHAYWQFYFLPFVVLSMLLAGRLLLRASGRSRVPLRVVAVAMVLDCLATSAYMLHLRHTRVGPFAVAQTARFRSQFLAPESAKLP